MLDEFNNIGLHITNNIKYIEEEMCLQKFEILY